MHDHGIKLGGVIPKFGFGACLLLMHQLWVFAWKCSQRGWCSPDLMWLFFLDVQMLCPNLSAELCNAELWWEMNLEQVSSCQEMARGWSAPVCPGGGRRTDKHTKQLCFFPRTVLCPEAASCSLEAREIGWGIFFQPDEFVLWKWGVSSVSLGIAFKVLKCPTHQ